MRLFGFEWGKPKPDSFQTDVVGRGKLAGEDPAAKAKRQITKEDAEAAEIIGFAELKELGVSKEILQLIRRCGVGITKKEVEDLAVELTRNLEYEGYDLMVTADMVVTAILGAKKLRFDRVQALKTLEELDKKTPTQEQRMRAEVLKQQLRQPVNILEVVVWQQAERLAGQEMAGNPTEEVIKVRAKQIRYLAWKKKANNLANAQARYELKKKYGDEHLIPIEEFNQLGLMHHKRYVESHPFKE